MRVIIQQNYDLVSEWAGNYVARQILKFKPTAKKPFVLGLPTGSSPIGMYKQLIKLNKKKVVSFKNVVTFNMDEYVNIAENHPESYHSFMWSNFFKHVDILKKNVNILNGNAKNLEKECDNYEKRIKRYGKINLFVGGIGPDGHIAFNEPGSSLTSRTRIKTLTYETVVANSRFFNDDINKVPKLALTVGVGTVLDSHKVLIIINGLNKSIAFQKVVEEGLNHMWTVSALQTHRAGIIVCDDDATLECKVKTVRYFKDIESRNLPPRTQLKNIK